MTTIVRRRALGIKSVKGIIAASKQADIRYANNYELIPHDDVYIRWGCTSTLPNRQATVINSAEGIRRVADKSGFRDIMNEMDLCPESWWYFEDVPLDMFPVVVRKRYHAQGRGLWLCRDHRELFAAVAAAGPGYYISQFIDKVKEFRVFVCQGRVVWVAEKTPGNPGAVAWNVNRGGRFDNVNWSEWDMEVINNALKVFDITRLHFSGIDVMVDAAGKAYCLEANSAPSQTSPYRQSCVAKAFDYMRETNNYSRTALQRDNITAKTWKGAIHPAVRGDRDV